MEYQIIKKIVADIFNEAKKRCPSNAHTTLSNHIESESNPRISNKTAIRAYKKYIDSEEMDWSPSPESIKNFCKYIGYTSYGDYVKSKVEKNELSDNNTIVLASKQKSIVEKNKKFILTGVLMVCFLAFWLQNKYARKTGREIDTSIEKECMAWAEDRYEKVDCGLQQHPKYGTKIEPYRPHLEKSMKKLDNDTVDASTSFFSDTTGKPLIWYYKTKEGHLEYFTAPGLHPVNGETLKKITEGMIEKYVPIHQTKPDSFLQKQDIPNVAVLVLNNDIYDSSIASNLTNHYFSGQSVMTLRDSRIYNKSFILNLSHNTSTIPKAIDTILVATSKYHLVKDSEIQDLFKCTLDIDYTLLHKSNNIWTSFISKNVSTLGSGFSKSEATSNAIKKISYD